MAFYSFASHFEKKKIYMQGRLAVCNLACEGLTGSAGIPNLAQRKLFIAGLSPEITSEMLLNYFATYGEIEEGSVAYDKDTDLSRCISQFDYYSVFVIIFIP